MLKKVLFLQNFIKHSISIYSVLSSSYSRPVRRFRARWLAVWK